jgi:hypothetical protein
MTYRLIEAVDLLECSGQGEMGGGGDDKQGEGWLSNLHRYLGKGLVGWSVIGYHKGLEYIINLDRFLLDVALLDGDLPAGVL